MHPDFMRNMYREQYRNYYRRHQELGSAERMVPAIVLIAIGAIFLLSNLHLLYIREWVDYWPALLVALGLVKLIDSNDSGARVGGGILVTIGGVLLARNLGYLSFSIWDLWPLVLIGAGVGMLFSRVWEWLPAQIGSRLSAATDSSGSDGKKLHEAAIFGGGKRTVTGEDFQGGQIDVVFGGYEIDLRRAMIAGESVTLNLNAVFGGIEVKVPQNWSVVARGTGVFGAFVDSTIQPDTRMFPIVKRLVVKGGAVFGGVEIKN